MQDIILEQKKNEKTKQIITTILISATALQKLKKPRYGYQTDYLNWYAREEPLAINKYENYGKIFRYVKDKFDKIIHDYISESIGAFTTLVKDFNVPRKLRGYFAKPHFLFSHEFHHNRVKSPYVVKPTGAHDEDQIDTLAEALPVDPYENGVSYG